LFVQPGTVVDQRELDDVFRAQRCDELARRPEGDDLAMVDDRDTVAKSLGLVHVMRREQNRAAGRLELPDELPDLTARLRIEPGRRLVEEEQLRIADDRAREREPLLLPSRKLADPTVALLVELDESDHFIDSAPACIEAAKEPHRFGDRQLLGELRLLKLNSEPFTKFVLVGRPAAAEHDDVALVRRGKPFADLDRRRLTGAVRPEKTEALARRNLEIEPVDGDDDVVPFAQPTNRYGERVAHGVTRVPCA